MANFTDDKTVWQNARTVDNYDPNKFRQDACGAWMAWDNYGSWCVYKTAAACYAHSSVRSWQSSKK